MNLTQQEGIGLAETVLKRSADHPGVEILLFPPFIHLSVLQSLTQARPQNNFGYGAQNCHHEASGAYTGEVSAPMLRDLGCGYVLLGHSERRQYFGETNAWLAAKVDRVLETGMQPVYCCGESLEERQADRTREIVATQLREGLMHISERALQQVVIAYEPVWAIGTGRTATPEQAQEAHGFIRTVLAEHYPGEVAQAVPLLYGGSVKPSNAAGLFAQEDIDGALVGGASLKADDFMAIAQASEEMASA